MKQLSDDNLKIDPELRLLVFPLTDAEYASFEEKLASGIYNEPVVCWYGYIISGFEQVEICQKNGIPFEVQKVGFCSKVDIISLICKRELKNRVLPYSQRRYLIGKLYNAETVIRAHCAAGTDIFKERAHRECSLVQTAGECGVVSIREQIGKEYHIDPITVSRYGTYAQGIDLIFQKSHKKAQRILKGELKIPVKNIMQYGLNPSEDLLIERTVKSVKKIVEPESMPVGPSIKDMPAFDPDAEISSLALTIPSWIHSMNRTRSTAKFPLITEQGRNKLIRELSGLISTAEKLRSALKEVM